VAVPTALALTPPLSTPSPSPAASPLPPPTPLASVVPAPTEPSVSPLAPAAEASGPTLDHKTTAKLQRIIDNWTGNKGVAGLQVAVRLPTGETWLGDAGQAEFSPDRPIDDETQFAIASVTKTFVAALILQLAEEGKVDLDATFGTYFRDAPRKDTVTLRQLLSHTSGIYNFWANPRYGEITKAWWETPNAGGLKSRSHEWTYDEMMALVKNGEFKPGKDYQYSNTNYLILGKVAEAVEGKSLAKQLRQRFFEPLGLEGTVYQPDQKPDTDAAHGHWRWGAGYTDHTKESRYVPFIAAVTVADAAGAMASTAADLATWASALYGGEVLPGELTEQMTRFLKPGYYGLGADVAYFAGNRGHGHRGGIRGYESSMWYFPETGVSIVMLSNQGNWGSDEVMGKLVKAVLGSN
jgi:D-alanyl-D-alanine carboxypeptidase